MATATKKAPVMKGAAKKGAAPPPAVKRGKQFPVDFLAYSGDGKQIGIGVRIKLSSISLETAFNLFACKRLEIRMFLGDDAPGQKTFWETADVKLATVADVRRFSVGPEQIGIRLMMLIDKKVNGHVLEQFSKQRGVLEILSAAEPDTPNATVPASELGDDPEDEEDPLDEEEEEEEEADEEE